VQAKTWPNGQPPDPSGLAVRMGQIPPDLLERFPNKRVYIVAWKSPCLYQVVI
jgi:hypothetical protein